MLNSSVLLWEFVAALCAGTFSGAAIYINLVEHPARLECGPAAAVAEFGPSYRRAAVMQASLAAVGSLASFIAWWQGLGASLLVAGLLLSSVIPFTVFVMLPTNKRLFDPALDRTSHETIVLLHRWGRRHAVRSAASAVAFVVLLVDMAGII